MVEMLFTIESFLANKKPPTGGFLLLNISKQASLVPQDIFLGSAADLHAEPPT
jgi:hypothetical protein